MDRPGLVWVTSSYSGTSSNCVEVACAPATMVPVSPWHTASYSAERGACVEVSEGPVTGVRDTKHRELGALFFGADEWRAFISSAKDRGL